MGLGASIPHVSAVHLRRRCPACQCASVDIRDFLIRTQVFRQVPFPDSGQSWGNMKERGDR